MKKQFDESLIKECGDGIYTIDTMFMRPHLVASHLLVEQEQVVFVDVGAATAVPILLAALDYLGLAPDQVKAVIVTHVHLDHAGGAGALMRHLPKANLVVHPRGAQHMIDPSRLIAGATAVYGNEVMLDRFGEIVPVPAERVIEADEVFRFRLGQGDNTRELRFIYTPGHALHHMCVYDEKSGGIFTGDSFGLSYPEFDVEEQHARTRASFIVPTTTPVQFDPQTSHDSIEKLMQFNPERMYLTHFGCIRNPVSLAKDLHNQIELFVEQMQAVSRLEPSDQFDALKEQLNKLVKAQLADHGCKLTPVEIEYLMAMDIDLNAQGLMVWWRRIEQNGIEQTRLEESGLKLGSKDKERYGS